MSDHQNTRFKEIAALIRRMYGSDPIPLHQPRFVGHEKEYLAECIDTTFVSSVGKFVDRFEQMCADYTGARHAVAAVNGTSALHIALQLAGVVTGDEVITQPLTFVATCNAISYTGASPVFVDVDEYTLGLSPDALKDFLATNTAMRGGICFNRISGRRIRACVPMHTFGHPCRIEEIKDVCTTFGIALVEDAAESLGSYVGTRHTGTFGLMGILSFNGNKVITTGGGGMILTDDDDLARRAKHITTTAKVPHAWEYVHDSVGYNYRLTNLAAALGCAQMECLNDFLASKRTIAQEYQSFFAGSQERFIPEPAGCRSNYWLYAVVLADKAARDAFLEFTARERIMTRPIWRLMNRLPMFSACQSGPLRTAEWLEDRVVNLPSSARV